MHAQHRITCIVAQETHLYMSVFLEILKITLPALVVALTSYFIIKEMLTKQLQVQEQKLRRDRQEDTMPLRMQAYERLSLLVERLSLGGLLLRTQHGNMQAATLKITLMLAVQQEFEHNISQQIYISEKLWQIIKATRDDLFQFIELVSEKIPNDAPAQVLGEALLRYHDQRDSDPIATAQAAIRREAATLF